MFRQKSHGPTKSTNSSELCRLFIVPALSGLTKKTVYADKLLATILGVGEGAHVSYADLTRGLHKYIREHDLKNLEAKVTETPRSVPLAVSGPPVVITPPAANLARLCRECGSGIPAEAVFCDLCGARQ